MDIETRSLNPARPRQFDPSRPGKKIEDLLGIPDRDIADLPGTRATETGRRRIRDHRGDLVVDEDIGAAKMIGPEGVVAEHELVGHQHVLANVAGQLGKLDHAVEHDIVAPGVGLALQSVGKPAQLGRLAQHVLGRQHLELNRVDRQQVLQAFDPCNRILDLAVERILDRHRIDRPRIGGEELVHQAGGVGKAGMHHRKVLLLRRQHDETAVHPVRIEIILVAQFRRDLRRKTGHVDVELGKSGRLQSETGQRLVIAGDQMRLGDGEQPAVDQFGFEETVHALLFTRPCVLFRRSSAAPRPGRDRRDRAAGLWRSAGRRTDCLPSCRSRSPRDKRR